MSIIHGRINGAYSRNQSIDKYQIVWIINFEFDFNF
jgi:hypothetical protein